MEQKIHYDKLKDEISAVRGTFYGSLGVICRIVFLFIANLLLARYLGPESYGIWALSFLILTLGNTLVIMGFDRGISRFIGRFRGEKETTRVIETINTAIILALGACLVISFILFIFSSAIAQLFKVPQLSWMLKIIAFTFIPASLVEIIGSIFRGYENIRLARIINSFIPAFLWISVIGILLFLGAINLKNVCFSYLFLIWISAGIAVYFLIKKISEEKFRFSLSLISNSVRRMTKSLLSFSFPLLLFNFLTLVNIYIDSFFIGYFLGAYKVGIYQVAFRIARLSPFLLLGSVDVFTPLISKKLAEEDSNQESINELYFRTTKWVAVPTLLIIITLMIFSDFFLSWFGTEYVQGDLVLKLLLLAYLIYALFGPTEAMNIALGSSRFVAGYTLFAALVSIFLNWLLIPQFGIKAAAVVAIISILLTKMLAFSKLYKVDGVTLFKSRYTQFVIFSTLTGFLCGSLIYRFINTGFYGIIIFVALFALFELFLLKSFCLIDNKDTILIKRTLSKLRSLFVRIGFLSNYEIGRPPQKIAQIGNDLLSVSVIIPCLNEERFISRCLDSVISQDYPKDNFEVLVIDGMSEDRTRQIIKQYVSRYPFVKLVDNKKKIIPAALNLGIKEAKGNLIIRMDAHATYERRYITKCVSAIHKYDADVVGGIIKTLPRKDTLLGKAIATVVSHPFGVGASYFRRGSSKVRKVDTVFSGCYRREIIEQVFPLDERIKLSEDIVYNLKLKRKGAKILIIPEISSNYYMHSNFTIFFRHTFRNGMWAIIPFKFTKMPVSFRHLVPVGFVLSLLISLILSFLSYGFLWIFLCIAGAYILANFYSSIQTAIRKRDIRYIFIMPFLFTSFHICYGTGSMYGLLKCLFFKAERSGKK